MQLTRALIRARHPRPVPLEADRSGDVPERELRSQLRAMLARRNRHGGGLWVFAYGSLIWRPEVEPDDELTGTLYGYHRRFCLKQVRSRGTPDNPCLMMALDRGGACRSRLHWFEAADEAALADRLLPLWRREMRGQGYVARYVQVSTSHGLMPAMTFVANASGVRYEGRLDLDAVARRLAGACGPRGACAEYLLHTVEALRAHGIRDRNLWALQERVAALLAGPLHGSAYQVASASESSSIDR